MTDESSDKSWFKKPRDINLAGFLIDRRLPPVDAKGALADRQIRDPQLQMIREEVTRNWPEVHAVRYPE